MKDTLLGNSTDKDSVPVAMTLHAGNMRSVSVTTNVGKFNLREILDKCLNEARKGRFEAAVDVDYSENDQRDLLRTLEHYGYAVTVANKFNEGQNTFYIKW